MGRVVQQKKILFEADMGNVELLKDICVENYLRVHFEGNRYEMHSVKKAKVTIQITLER